MTSASWPQTMLMVGCGNMAGAMLAGWLAADVDPGRFTPPHFTIVDPVLPEAPEGTALLRALPAGAAPFDAILLGIKPQMLGDLAPGVERLAGSETAVLSMLAGVELASLARHFPRAGGLVRLMPNLAAAIGKSPIALAGERLTEERRSDITALFSPLGTPEWLAGEALFDAVTALAGSGPAFVYRFIDALARAGEATGLPRGQADRLAMAMVEGASLLAARSEHSPAELARRVASPGGTTQAGLDALDKDDALAAVVEAAIRAARDRSAEMAAEAAKA
jgi:pyrroline-5-carboxylate reductase